MASRRAMSRLVLPCDTNFRISFCRGVSPSDRLLRAGVGLATLTGFLFLVEEEALEIFAGFLA